LVEIFKYAHEQGIEIPVISSDMASGNRAIWRILGVFANRKADNCLITNPADSTKKTVFMPDPPHTIKNFKGATTTYKIDVPKSFFEKHGLIHLYSEKEKERPKVDVKKWLKRLIAIQRSENLSLVPGLNESHIFPNTWEKMRMMNTLMVINDKVVMAIIVCVHLGLK